LVIAETIGLHFLLSDYHWLLPLCSFLLSLSSLVWLMDDYATLGRFVTTITADDIVLRVGRRAAATIPRKHLATAVSPSWRDLPDPLTGSLLNVTAPTEPNILLTFHDPVTIRFLGGLQHATRTLALFVDTPDAFLAALRNPQDTPSNG